MLFSTILLIGSLTPSAGPAFLATDAAPSVSALLSSGFRAVQRRTLDIDSDGKPETLVLVAADTADGAGFPSGLLVCRIAKRAGPSRTRAVAAVTLPFGAGYDDVTFAPAHPDLDGDGLLELALDERVGGGGVRLHGTSFWRLGPEPDGPGRSIRSVYTLSRRYEYGKRSEERSFRQLSAGILIEHISIQETDGKKARTEVFEHEVELRWNPHEQLFERARW